MKRMKQPSLRAFAEGKIAGSVEPAISKRKVNDELEQIRNSLSPNGRQLLNVIVQHVANRGFKAGDPSTYLGYKDCCVALAVAPASGDIPWGRLLQKHGLSDLNEWTNRHNLPRVSGLVVNQTGDRQYWPGGDYFGSNGRPDMDGTWWEDQAKKAAQMDWRPYL